MSVEQLRAGGPSLMHGPITRTNPLFGMDSPPSHSLSLSICLAPLPGSENTHSQAGIHYRWVGTRASHDVPLTTSKHLQSQIEPILTRVTEQRLLLAVMDLFMGMCENSHSCVSKLNPCAWYLFKWDSIRKKEPGTIKTTGKNSTQYGGCKKVPPPSYIIALEQGFSDLLMPPNHCKPE